MNKNILSYSIKWFVVVVVVSVALWAIVFDYISRPTDTEQICLFLTAEASDPAKIKQKSALDDIGMVVVTASESDTYYGAQFSTTALIKSDLVVMNVDKMPQSHAELQFAPLNNDLLAKYGLASDGFTLVLSDGIPYGIVVFDKQNNIDLLQGLARFDPTNVYCIAVNCYMPNAAPYSQAKQTTNNAFVALAKLLGD